MSSLPKWFQCHECRHWTIPLLLWLLLPAGLSALFDPTKTPAEPPPASRWGDLEPGPIVGDSTHHNLGTVDPPPFSFWYEVDIEGSYLYTVSGLWFEIYNISNPQNPQQLSRKYAPTTLPRWFFSDQNFFFFDVSVPGSGAPGDTSGTTDLAIMSGLDQGFVVWNTRNKSTPTVHYQDSGGGSGILTDSVYAARLSSRYYGFAADNTGAGGILVYDLTAAQSLAGCSENTRAGGINCAGVYKGRVGSQSSAAVIDGAGDFLAVRRATRNVEIWNVANPLSPFQRLTGQFPAFTGEIAMWKDTRGATTKHYLAGLGTTQLWIYDVSCITGIGGCSLPTPTTVAVPEGSSGTAQQKRLSFSWGGSTPYLYVGNDNVGTNCVNQREYLIDVNVPSNPQFIQYQTGGNNYWGWYYFACSTGFNEIRPLHARFHPTNGHLYRAAHSVLDSHELVGTVTPACAFSWNPQIPNAGQAVSFSDMSSGNPDQWSWTFQDATPPTSTSQNPQNVTFTSGGSKQVTLVATNSVGSCPTAVQFVTVNQPQPPVCNFTWAPTTPQIGEQVDFTDISTNAPTQWSWSFQDGAPGSSTTQNPQNVVFNTAGQKTVTLTATNAVGTCPPVQKVINVTPPVPPVCNFTWTPQFPIVGELVTFIDGSTGQPAQWSWTFQNGVPPASASQNPQASFLTTGNKTVTLVASNSSGSCPTVQKTVEVGTSVPLAITNFKASCPLGDCFGFQVGVPISFSTIVTGGPLAYDYDWDGNGVFEETSASAVASHTYCATGSYEPVLRIRRGSQSVQMADSNATNLVVNAGTACSAPVAPGGLIASALVASIKLDWNDNSSNETGFRILRQSDSNGFFPIGQVGANIRTFTDTTAAPGVAYTYKIQAYATTGASDSNTSSATIVVTIPPLFLDGFELGNLSLWVVCSETSPGGCSN